VSKLWDSFTEFLDKEFKMDSFLAYKISSLSILNLTAKGYSNARVSSKLLVSVKDVESTLINLLHFTGWEHDLDFSPLAIFNRCKTFSDYQREVYVISAVSEKIIVLSYNVVYLYKQIVKDVDKYYGN